tara:strand:+ start:154 stop:291 length:138 start_codon:yes stop_codon:yes gene_type:complete
MNSIEQIIITITNLSDRMIENIKIKTALILKRKEKIYQQLPQIFH